MTACGFNREVLRRALIALSAVLLLGAAVLIVWAGARVRANSTVSRGAYLNRWSPAAAASYLDGREAWWQAWPQAQLSQRTFCISCHTSLLYAMARPGLRAELGETALTDGERALLSSIEARVTDWPQTRPYYMDSAHKEPSHATEAVLDALILAEYSAADPRLCPTASRAFDEAWALQKTSGDESGGWDWQNFHEAPWESDESAYQGAVFMVLAVAAMPVSCTDAREVRDHVDLLRSYIRRHYDSQPPINQLYVLWASSQMQGLLDNSQRKQLIEKVCTLQRPDGGWSLPSIDRQKAVKKSALDFFKRVNQADGSDGIATGLAVLALETSGVGFEDPVLKHGLAWLKSRQFGEGSWWGSSLNGFRNPSTDLGRFMSDAATGYAVLALEAERNLHGTSQPKKDGNGASAKIVQDPDPSVRTASRAADIPM